MPIREQQTTNKQHAIPQSIMSVEFKIIGDLTLKQFFFLLIFCGLAYTSFMAVGPFIIKWLLVIFFTASGLAFAFMPLGDRGLDTWIVNFLRAMFLPNQFVYRKDENVPSVFLYQNLDVLRSELITLTPTSSRRKIEAYLEQQEVPVDKLDIDEKGYILKVKEAYSHSDYWSTAGIGPATAPAAVTTTVVEDLGPNVGQPQNIPSISSSETSQPPQDTEFQQSLPTQAPAFAIQQDLTRLELPTGRPPADIVSSVRAQQAAYPETQVLTEKPGDSPVPEETLAQIIKSRAGAPAYRHHKQVQDGFYSPAITPDMHAGRRFINLSQEAGRGEIILPIRGERVLKSTQEQEFEASEKQKISDLDALINDVKSKELVQKQIINAQKAKEQEDVRKHSQEEETRKAKENAQKQAELEHHEGEQKRLEQEKNLTEQQERETQAREQAVKEQGRLAALRQQEETLRRQKEDIIKKQREEEDARLRLAQTQTSPRPQPIPLQPAQTGEAPTTPNIIWGVITTSYQNSKASVPGVVIVVRNQKGEVVRAVKTSSQGRFGISTPLVNGSYTIEVDKEKKSGLNFAITAVDAKGETIPTIEICGKA